MWMNALTVLGSVVIVPNVQILLAVFHAPAWMDMFACGGDADHIIWYDISFSDFRLLILLRHCCSAGGRRNVVIFEKLIS